MMPFVTPMMMGGAGLAAPPLVANVYKTTLYTGNGGTQTVNTGLNAVANDVLLLLKGRSNSTDPGAFDTKRGAYNLLRPDVTNAEATTTGTQDMYAFTSSGFSVGTAVNIALNNNTFTFVAWEFVKAARFVDIITWTGNGANRTLPHSLGVAPAMVIVKRRDTTGAWIVQHRSLAGTEYKALTSSNKVTDATVWNSILASASDLSLGTHVDVNATAGTYVAYLFAHDSAANGIIQGGTFTTNGSGVATVSGLPFQPQFVLMADVAGSNWMILDTTRGWTAGADNRLWLNTGNSESVATDFGAPTSDGFTLAGLNVSATYIYLTIKA